MTRDAVSLGMTRAVGVSLGMTRDAVGVSLGIERDAVSVGIERDAVSVGMERDAVSVGKARDVGSPGVAPGDTVPSSLGNSPASSGELAAGVGETGRETTGGCVRGPPRPSFLRRMISVKGRGPVKLAGPVLPAVSATAAFTAAAMAELFATNLEEESPETETAGRELGRSAPRDRDGDGDGALVLFCCQRRTASFNLSALASPGWAATGSPAAGCMPREERTQREERTLRERERETRELSETRRGLDNEISVWSPTLLN
eukprot:Gregarina_sp_Pseudo_9__1820@NODE_223_length_3533_cov_22_527476_g207_i0_p2_GENE_NODE_223_length_3533_cov_22_527476_g207_i0NODE_223_length_3533_cov_22_527476_g207_i0_p2_ORF_typecomplete_len260_score64_50_NODE_223_length_3533_cov_22_527476_g207_i014482227